MTMRHSRRAYTPEELLVAVVIMGFLAAMVTPKLYGILAYSETSIDAANLRELETAMAGFAALHQRLPQVLVNLVDETSGASASYRMPSIHDRPGETADLSACFRRCMCSTRPRLRN